MKAPNLVPRVDGNAAGETLFFVQGWPDDHTLWDSIVRRLQDRHRCVRIDLPNYDGAEYRRWGYDHGAIADGVSACIRAVAPDAPVTLIAHDWGALWAYDVQHRHPELVRRLVGLDVGPRLKPTLGELAFLIAYQWWLLIAFVVGGPIGAWMTRRLARLARAPRRHQKLSAAINYPYLYTWRDIFTGQLDKRLRRYAPQIPILFVYGEEKPARFHTERWLELVRSHPEGRVVALDGTGHWVTTDPRFDDLLATWLEDSV